MRLSILIYDGMTSLDAVGGYEVLARVPGLEVEFVAERQGVVAMDTRRMGLLAYRSFSEVQSTDILYVPGGPGGYALEKDPVFLDYLRKLDQTSTWTVGICNGVGLLAAAGLLKGQRAATNWFERERITQYGVEFVPERFHREGKYITGAGVSASIDTGLFLAQLLAGDMVAKAIQLGIEYFPAPPFSEKSPVEMPAPVQQVVAEYEASSERPQLLIQPPFASIAHEQAA